MLACEMKELSRVERERMLTISTYTNDGSVVCFDIVGAFSRSLSLDVSGFIEDDGASVDEAELAEEEILGETRDTSSNDRDLHHDN